MTSEGMSGNKRLCTKAGPIQDLLRKIAFLPQTDARDMARLGTDLIRISSPLNYSAPCLMLLVRQRNCLHRRAAHAPPRTSRAVPRPRAFGRRRLLPSYPHLQA